MAYTPTTIGMSIIKNAISKGPVIPSVPNITSKAISAPTSNPTKTTTTQAGPTIAGLTTKKSSSHSSSTIVPAVVASAVTAGALSSTSEKTTELKQELSSEEKPMDSTYDKIDTALGGILPAGVPITSSGVATGLRIAGVAAKTAGIAGLAYGGYTLADKYLFDGKLPLGAARQSNGKKYKRMNYTNLKALKKADKRIDGFIKVARKAVSSVGYTIKRRESASTMVKRK